MIFYNGQALESIAPVKIEDIRVSPIVQEAAVRERPLKAGAQFIRRHEGTRTVNITFAIIEQNYGLRQKYIEAVTAWALSAEQPAPMQLPYHENKVIYVVCTGLPEPSTRQWWESRLNLTFTAYDPYFYDLAERSAPCGTAFRVYGNAEPKMRIIAELNTAQNLTYSSGGNTMAFTAVPAGLVEIDLNKQTAKCGGNTIMDKYALTSRFIVPHTGIMTISGTGTVKWREAYEA